MACLRRACEWGSVFVAYSDQSGKRQESAAGLATWTTSIRRKSQTSPIIVGRTLFTYTPTHQLIALDAATGVLRWRFDAGIRGTGPARGLAYWNDGKERRVLASVMNYLFALDPETGQPIAGFGDEGAIDLRKSLGGDYTRHYAAMTSPGVVYKDLIIVGFRTVETLPAPPGDIRAYDVRTGALRWTFQTLPSPGEFGADSWSTNPRERSGAANSWSGLALDRARGIVYVPTGSAVPDFVGTDRPGDNLFANSLLALDATTGKRLWHFQVVHHDIWDRDLPSPPSLLTVKRKGSSIDAVAQTTKQGFVFVFDRVTGEPLFPIEERPYPASDLPGEMSSPTQPWPVLPEPIARQQLTADMLTTRTPEAHAVALQKFQTFRSAGQFVPLKVDVPTVVFPGFDGGAEWGGSAVDRRTGVLYVNANDVAWTGALTENVASIGPGAMLYQSQCSVCHGVDRKGSPPAMPSLEGVFDRLPAAQITEVIRAGRGRMPPFASVDEAAVQALLEFLRGGADAPAVAAVDVNREATPSPLTSAENSAVPAREAMTVSLRNANPQGRFRFTGYQKFLDPDGYPAVAPPWGTLNAIDLNTGKYLWKIPLGEYPELAAQGMHETGSENYGGPIVTAGGLLFIGATVFDHKLRAFNSRTGELLWQYELPFAGNGYALLPT